MMRVLGFLLLSVSASCGVREPVPPIRANDARFGRMAGDGEPPSARAVCEHWTTTVFARDEWATTHVSFPETNPSDACFTPVDHRGREVTVGPPPRGCAYPTQETRPRLEALAKTLTPTHRLFQCSVRYMTDAHRAASAKHDAAALEDIARDERRYPYAAIIVPGHGEPEQNETPLADWAPGAPCRALTPEDRRKLGAMPYRAARAADAYRGGVAPLVIATGSAVHSRVVEAFALMHLLTCDEHVPASRVVLEPCADHTHTNLRNGGRWVHALGGRAAYLLTDDWIQSEYFQDLSAFNFILGSIDQRSTRSWGYLIGSWRQASTGTTKAGFWFTPYRFWAEPRDGLGSLTCVDRD
ncbi:MAG: YdcF family protein [Deltaproteobacteria bacterium]|nr:YdcF family protein [Deltaproteobacteria bacterium]